MLSITDYYRSTNLNHTPFRVVIMEKKYQKIANVSKDVEKLEPSALLKRMKDGAATMETSMLIPQKIKNRRITCSSNIASKHIPPKTEYRL